MRDSWERFWESGSVKDYLGCCRQRQRQADERVSYGAKAAFFEEPEANEPNPLRLRDVAGDTRAL